MLFSFCDFGAQERREKKRKLEHEAQLRELDETYDMLVDKSSGRIYWLNKLTLTSTYKDPYAFLQIKGIERRRELEVRLIAHILLC